MRFSRYRKVFIHFHRTVMYIVIKLLVALEIIFTERKHEL